MESQKQPIIIQPATTQQQINLFWEQLHLYFKRDIFPKTHDEARAYFLSKEYQEQIQAAHDRTENPCHYLFFLSGNTTIGFAMPTIFHTEDGKCFILEFCIYPEFRNQGKGQQAAAALLNWAAENQSRYAELNCGGDPRRLRFWQKVGFIPNGFDQWGEPLAIYLPKTPPCCTVELLTDSSHWQLQKLLNGFFAETEQKLLTEEKFQQLQKAIQQKTVFFFIAKCGYRWVGMCSISPALSSAVDNLFVEPAFRSKGIAGRLKKAAKEWLQS